MVKQNTRWHLPIILGVLWLFMLSVSPTIALATNRIGIRSGALTEESLRSGASLIYEVDPVKVKEISDSVELLNLSNNKVIVKVMAVDGILLGDGGFTLEDEKGANDSLGNWFVWDKDKTIFTIPANSNLTAHFTIKIPENPEVGDHIGGIVIQEIDSPADPTLKSGGANIRIRTRVGLRAYVTILGDIERGFKIRGRKFLGVGNQMVFKITAEGLGNIRSELKMNTKIYGLFGLYDSKDDLAIGQILPKKKATFTVSWPGKDRPIFGPYLAIMKIRDDYKPITENTALVIPPAPKPVTTWAVAFFVPWTQLGILLILLFVIWFLIQVKRWRNMLLLSRVPVVVYKVKKGDHLVDIANEYGMGWKLLAKLNDIKPPYSLRGITKIYVPDARGARRDIRVPHFFTYLTKPARHFVNKIIRHFFKKAKPYYTIIVDKGDTKKDIEKFTGMSWAEIARYNSLGATARPKVGQELKVPNRRKNL